MKKENYKRLRNAYYAGIMVLVVYALQFIGPVNEYVIPLLNTEIIPGVTLIGIVGVATAIGAFSAYKYRTLG